MGGRGRRGFLGWSLAGAALCFSFLTGFSIGLFVLPFAVVLLVVAVRRWPHLREATGFVSGVGLILLVVAFLNRDYRACPANGVLKLEPGQSSVSCGGFDPHPWLYAGIAFTLAGVFAYALAARTRRPA